MPKICVEPNEDSEASEEAEAIASVLIASQPSFDCFRLDSDARDCSREEDFRSWDVKLRARGLKAMLGDFALESLMDADDGEVTSFLPRGLVKLHFFEGVL